MSQHSNLLAAATAMVCLAGCAKPAVDAKLALDASRSFRNRLPWGARLATDVLLSLNAHHDSATVYRFDHEVRVIATKPPEGEEAANQILGSELAPIPRKDGTFPGQQLSVIADDCKSPGPPVIAILVFDGEIDSIADRDLLRSAARRLAANPRVWRIWLVGLKPETHRLLSELLGELGERLRLRIFHESGSNEIHDDIGSARLAAQSEGQRDEA